MSRPVVLILRALGLGDFLTGLPAIALLRHRFPEHELVLAAPPVYGPIVELVSFLDRLTPTGELMPLDPAFRHVDVAVDLHGNGPASRQLLAELEPGRLAGFADPGGTLVGPVWTRDEHEVARWCRLVAEAFAIEGEWPGVAGTVGVPRVDVPPGLTIVHPGAAAGSRRWPAERFAELAGLLRRDGHSVVITGGPGEAGLAHSIAAESDTRAMPGLSLSELFGLVAAARLVVSGDTGVAHVASAYQTPSVVLFGPIAPAVWGPPADGPHVPLFHGDGRGDPHGTEVDPALLAITVGEVLDATRSRRIDSGCRTGGQTRQPEFAVKEGQA